jgi:hypothetical protein
MVAIGSLAAIGATTGGVASIIVTSSTHAVAAKGGGGGHHLDADGDRDGTAKHPTPDGDSDDGA